MAGELVNVNPAALNSTIEFLTAMVTPTLLISATGSLVLSTSTRLGRVVDRVRQLEVRLGELRIEGLGRYPAHIITNLNEIKPGDEYSEVAMQSYQARLQDTGYFSSVEVSVDMAAALKT